MKRAIGILAVFVLMASVVIAQETTPLPPENPAQRVGAQKVADLDGVKIYEYYKNCAVDVKVAITLETGEILEAGGSGSFWDKEGHVLTCAHVVRVPNDQIPFLFGPPAKIISYEYSVSIAATNRAWKAEIVGWNHDDDSALLKAQDIDPKDFNVAKLGNADSLKVGERVYALGSPFGLSDSYTTGTVSALHRYLGSNYLEDYIQSDVSVNFGNSGGPMINAQGEVVGINARMAVMGGNMTFAVPLNLMNIEQLKKGEVRLPWFGAEALINNFRRYSTEQDAMIEDLSQLNKLTGIRDIDHLSLLAKLSYKDRWAIVTLVDETKSADGKLSPAKRAGFKKGDLITKVNGKVVAGGMDIRRIIVGMPLDKEFEVEYIRIDKSGVPQTVTAKLKLEKKPPPKMNGGHNH
jgi:serine protease Do